jgi:hypothetical protein
MVDYSGIAKLVNTSAYQGTGKVLHLYLNPLPVYNLTLNLSNPLSGYSHSNVPPSGLTVTGISLPVSYDSTNVGSNYTVFHYVLPNGTYNFRYSDVNYVTLNFTASLNGAGKFQNETLNPYVLKLSWDTNATWTYDLSGPGISIVKGLGGQGASDNYTALESGSYSFSVYLGTNLLVNSTTFTLYSSAPNKSLSFNAKYNSEELKNVPVNVSFPGLVLKLKTNLSSNQTVFTEYISNISINVNVSSNSTLSIGTSGPYNPFNNVFAIPNYFVLGPNGKTTLSITADISSSELTQVASGVNLTVTYYTTNLTG